MFVCRYMHRHLRMLLRLFIVSCMFLFHNRQALCSRANVTSVEILVPYEMLNTLDIQMALRVNE